ncbi:hypothetical protein VHEMI05572 [[Torrubiella] hemipterigena]|uniref:ABM domain-containing protein n=1 Tax=[Torrubiella] hemipterigena TaxID=1531966 RepID=A0A0A1TJ43_9HYPO|nr:hypothetical protein VHEMI05572 [[Torrubiella] hemipterigena]
MSTAFVTECATLKLNEQCSLPVIKDILAKCFTIQDGWIAEHDPSLAKDNRRHTIVYTDNATKPQVLYFLASWHSAKHHYEWIATEENRQCGELLKPILSSEPGAVALLHLHSASREPCFADITGGEVWHVTRMLVPSAKKAETQQHYQEIERSQESQSCWAGWNAELPPEQDEFVVFQSSKLAEETFREVLSLNTSCEKLTIFATTI